MAFEEDFDVYFSDFGTSAVLDDGSSVDVIFDQAYIASLMQVESSGPMAVLKSTDAETAELAQGSRLAIGGIDYVIAEAQPDGTGITVLQLHKDA